MKRFVLLGALLAGCGLFTGDDNQHTCPVYNAGPGGEPPAQGFRDPSSGQCVYEDTGGGGYDCSDPDCPCAEPEGIPDIVHPKEPVQPDGGTSISVQGGECYGPCSGLGEQACLADSSCHAAYLDAGGGAQFWSCWDIEPDAPSFEPCAGLDAFTCSTDPQCSSTYTEDSNGNTSFLTCTTNAGSGCDCGSGFSCVDECPAEACPVNDSGCGICTPTCVPNNDPGQCTGSVLCNMAPPACPAGTTAGIANNCYTGYCIPNANCGPAACASLTDEASCTARPDCDAVYMGSNCTCDDSGCTCTTLTFERCEPSGDSGSGVTMGGSGNGSGI